MIFSIPNHLFNAPARIISNSFHLGKIGRVRMETFFRAAVVWIKYILFGMNVAKDTGALVMSSATKHCMLLRSEVICNLLKLYLLWGDAQIMHTLQ